MSTNEDRVHRRFLDYMQKLEMYGVSRSEIERGQGSHSVRVIGPRTVLPYYANLRRCKKSGRHDSKPGGCPRCSAAFQQITQIVQIEDGGAGAAMVQSARTDEEKAAPLASSDWGIEPEVPQVSDESAALARNVQLFGAPDI